MHYASIQDADALVRKLGKGSLLAKLDLHQAYRVVPVHADNHPLLGIRWGSSTFIDSVLPFGLRSAPKIFSAVADTLTWGMYSNGVQLQLHYLDDFLFVGPPNTTDCATALLKALQTCEQLGVPFPVHKMEGPST